MHGMSPSRPRGCGQANYQQLIPKLQFKHCIMHKLHDWSKKVLYLAKVLADLCTKQVVSARACANQFLPYSSSGIALCGMTTVQADSCLNSEQIDTIFISVFSLVSKFTRDCHGFLFCTLLLVPWEWKCKEDPTAPHLCQVAPHTLHAFF